MAILWIDDDNLLKFYIQEVKKYTEDEKVIELFTQLYKKYVYGLGNTDEIDFEDIPKMVEREYTKRYIVIGRNDPEYEQIKSIVKEEEKKEHNPYRGLIILPTGRYKNRCVECHTADYELFLIDSEIDFKRF